MSQRIHVSRKLPLPALEKLYASGLDIFVGPEEPPSRSRFLWAVGGAVGLLTSPEERVDKDVMDCCPGLKAISVCGESLDSVDLDEASLRGIVVCCAAAGPDLDLEERTAVLAVENLLAALGPTPPSASVH